MTLSELKSLHERATPGPWVLHEDGLGVDAPARDRRARIVRWYGRLDVANDYALIVALRNAFPLLCAEVEASRKLADVAKDIHHNSQHLRGALQRYDAARRATEGA